MKKAKVAADQSKLASEVAKKVAPGPQQVKQVLAQILQQFINEEAGNKVTRNNMAGLTLQIHGAIDGHITLQKPQEGDTP
jgi:glycine betaine/choline ABC-type transport system substrate-binding protein